MPFQSKAQQGFMFAKHPKIAKRWAKETKDFDDLPAKKGKGDFAIKGLKRAAQKCKDCGKAKCECEDED
jgi:hypothetical protein